jgi:hypothetical protein
LQWLFVPPPSPFRIFYLHGLCVCTASVICDVNLIIIILIL